MNEITINCECGTHMLKVQSYVEDDIQDFYLAMFSYGNKTPTSIRERVRIALKYLHSGKMFSDQIVMTPQEATKLATFITDNVK